MSSQQLGTVAMVGVGWFVAAVLALHFLEPDFDIVYEYTSDYASGESFGWLMNSAFFAAGIGSGAIALGLRESLEPGKRVSATVGLFILSGVSFLIVGIFNGDVTSVTDLTTSGIVHVAASVLLFATQLVAVWFLRGVFKRDSAWEGLASAQMWFAIAYTFGFLGTFLVPEDGPVGATQRVFITVMMAWLAFLAWQIRTFDVETASAR